MGNKISFEIVIFAVVSIIAALLFISAPDYSLPSMLGLLFLAFMILLFRSLSLDYKKAFLKMTATAIGIVVALYMILLFLARGGGGLAVLVAVAPLLFGLIVVLFLWLIASLWMFYASRKAGRLSIISSPAEHNAAGAQKTYSIFVRIFIYTFLVSTYVFFDRIFGVTYIVLSLFK